MEKVSSIIRAGARARFYPDEIGHLKKAAGFRFDLRNGVESPFGVEYYQVYPTDRVLLSLKDKGNVAKHIEPQQVLENYNKVKDNHFKRVIKVFKDASVEEYDVGTRTEVRVPWLAAYDVQWVIPDEEAEHCFFIIQTKDYWDYKVVRLESYMAAMDCLVPKLFKIPERQLSAPVTLLVGLCWMTNATINRPDVGKDFDVLADTLCVHRKINDTVCPVIDLDFFTLHSFKEDGYARVSSHRTVSDKVLAYLCGIKGAHWHGEYVSLVRSNGRIEEDTGVPQWGQSEGTVRQSTLQLAGSKRKSHWVVTAASGPRPSRKKQVPLPPNATSVIAGSRATRLSEGPVAAGYQSEEEDPEHPFTQKLQRTTSTAYYSAWSSKSFGKSQ
ncbi:hypothetical protein RSOL_525870, partial [Rhizoctonia solani AG-3 Rhs1AP]